MKPHETRMASAELHGEAADIEQGDMWFEGEQVGTFRAPAGPIEFVCGSAEILIHNGSDEDLEIGTDICVGRRVLPNEDEKVLAEALSHLDQAEFGEMDPPTTSKQSFSTRTHSHSACPTNRSCATSWHERSHDLDEICFVLAWHCLPHVRFCFEFVIKHVCGIHSRGV